MTTTLDTVLATLRGVSRTYGSGEATVHALRDVDLDVEPGQLVVVLGPSGSGKTTLLNLLGGIESPTSGEIIVDGRDLHALGPDGRTEVRRDSVGFVFQFFNLIPVLTARENVAVLAELTGRKVGDRVDTVLDEVGLADRADHFPGQLSGGQQQRVGIARALVKSPRLLLCDEPTGALDLDTGRVVLDLLRRRTLDGGTAVVIVTHNQAIAGMADRVIRLRSGELVADEHPDRPLPASEVTW